MKFKYFVKRIICTFFLIVLMIIISLLTKILFRIAKSAYNLSLFKIAKSTYRLALFIGRIEFWINSKLNSMIWGDTNENQ